MKESRTTSKRRSVHEPVPHGKAREEALAAIVAEARVRMRSAPSIWDSLTSEEWEEIRANDPEILGSGGAKGRAKR